MKKPSLQQLLRKAKQLSNAGEQAEARALYESILERFPANQSAERALSTLSEKKPEPDESVFQKLEQQYFEKNYQSVLGDLQSLLSKYPRSARLWNIYGAVYQSQGATTEAISAFERVTELNPRFPDGYNNLGVVLHEAGKHEESIKSLRQAVQLNPKYPEAWSNLGLPLTAIGEWDDAISSFENALKIQPNSKIALNNMGAVYLKKGDYRKAHNCFDASLKLDPSYVDALINMGVVFVRDGSLPDARRLLSKALTLVPDNPAVIVQFLFVSRCMCEWDTRTHNDRRIADLGVATRAVYPWPMLAFEDNSMNQRRRSERYAKERFSLEGFSTKPPYLKSSNKIRLGYFSSDFCAHATLILLTGLFRCHDRNVFDIYVFSYGKSTNDFREQLERYDCKFFDITDFSNDRIVLLARQISLDVAIDLKGYTEGTRVDLFSLGLAPVQIAFLGYPGTTGAQWMDYIIADKVVIPEAAREAYTEKVIYLPHCYQPNDDLRPLPDPMPNQSRSEMGLPEDGFVFCCFNSSYKISHNEFHIWMRILQRVPDAVLWLYAGNPWVKDNLLAQAENAGISRNRLIFADKVNNAEHLARHHCADLFLDTFNVNAHTTASDALWMGLPIVTKCGEQFSARVAASLLHAIGVDELITQNEWEYEQLIMNLATNRDRLRRIKERIILARKTAPLFNTAMYGRAFEASMVEVVRRVHKGEVPADFEITLDGVARALD